MRLPLFTTSLCLILIAACAQTTTAPAPRGDGFAGLNIHRELMIPPGKHARKRMERMRPTGITVHSTQSFGRGADARAHARGLYNGVHTATHNSLGYLVWHFTVDSNAVYQSLPTNERGEHADYEGPGNRTTIGIEMCENSDGNRAATVDRTARLIAALMHQHGIPLDHVVPHQHWYQIRYSDGKRIGHKNCPHFLLENGKPGARWAAFKQQIARHYRSMT